MGWCHGFKLHLACNDRGEIVAFVLTGANVSDKDPEVFKVLAKRLYGKLFADKGYISQRLFDCLFEDGIQLVTGLRVNMKNKLMPFYDRMMLRKRYIIEIINDMLKNTAQIVHSRIGLLATSSWISFLHWVLIVSLITSRRHCLDTVSRIQTNWVCFKRYRKILTYYDFKLPYYIIVWQEIVCPLKIVQTTWISCLHYPEVGYNTDNQLIIHSVIEKLQVLCASYNRPARFMNVVSLSWPPCSLSF